MARSISSHFFAEIVNVFEHCDFLVVVYKIKYKQNLREFLEKNRPLKEDTIKSILSQLALALGDAQRASVIVRQLNPELIFINPIDMSIVICDLSCAVVKPDLSRPIFRSCVGFIAPEIVNDKPYSSKAGCFAIGVVTYML